MRTQNYINFRYRPKSLEEIKAEIQKPRPFVLPVLNFQREENTADFGVTLSKRKENTAGTGATQPKREKTKESNPLLTFIIVLLVIWALFIPGVNIIVGAFLFTALICS